MNSEWADEARARPNKHGSVVRQAVFYTISALGCGAILLYAFANIVTGQTGYVVMLTVFGIFWALTSYQAIHYIRDVNTPPVALEGEMFRKWHKANLLFFFLPSYYIYVSERQRPEDLLEDDRKPWAKIFTVRRDEYALLLETDLVRVTCYPHSLTVEQVERYDETEKRFVPAADGASG